MKTREDDCGFDGISGDGPIFVDTMLENMGRISQEAIDFYDWAIWDSNESHLSDQFAPEVLRIYLGMARILDRCNPNGFIRDFLAKTPQAQRAWFDEVAKRGFGKHRAEYDKGYVYAFLFDNGLVKIGKSASTVRHRDFTVGAASVLVGYHYFATDNRHSAENKAHKHFADRRSHGEFFKISYDEALEYLSSRYVSFMHS